MKLPAGLALVLGLLGPGRAAEPVVHPDTRPVPLTQVEPVYPPELKAQRVVGSVQLRGIIDEEGNLRDLAVEAASQDAFGRAALAAVAQWKFRPATKDGRPCAIRFGVPVDFSLNARDLDDLEAARPKETPPPGPAPLEVEAVDDWPVLRKEIQPKTPEILRRRKQLGETILVLVVDESGATRDVHTLVTTQVECAEAAETAARQWRFKPARQAGRPVRTTLEVNVVFFPENTAATGLRVRPGVRVGSQAASRLSAELRQARSLAQLAGGPARADLPKIRKQPPPEYPGEMADRTQRGYTDLEFIIDARGRVSLVRTLAKTNAFFAIMAERAVSQWEFEPARVDGRAVPCLAKQRIEFGFEYR